MKRRNTIAKDLRSPKYRPRIVKSKKTYSRKGVRVVFVGESFALPAIRK